jgi:hypothetical protein
MDSSRMQCVLLCSWASFCVLLCSWAWLCVSIVCQLLCSCVCFCVSIVYHLAESLCARNRSGKYRSDTRACLQSCIIKFARAVKSPAAENSFNSLLLLLFRSLIVTVITSAFDQFLHSYGFPQSYDSCNSMQSLWDRSCSSRSHACTSIPTTRVCFFFCFRRNTLGGKYRLTTSFVCSWLCMCVFAHTMPCIRTGHFEGA